MIQLRPNQVAEWARNMRAQQPGKTPVVLDVREPWEVQTAAIRTEGTVDGFELLHMPMRSVPARYPELDRQQPVACLCHHGARSMQVAFFLENQGFTQVANIEGGINAWAMQHDPSVPLY